MLESDRAILLLDLLRWRNENKDGPIIGYEAAAGLIGFDGVGTGRPMGQVCSRLDLACFYAGLPLIASHMVRQQDGEIMANFSEDWGKYADEIMETASSYQWTVADYLKVRAKLDQIPETAAKLQWKSVTDRGDKFVRWNLHRMIEQPRYA